ncbi:MAG: sigma-E processing peptidase SpoIIGA [Oscillospiraceae bacterium]|nr:sigma-E processing peptidase SpoIIGA [Oscillospiraceae bacterium]
MVIYLDGVMGLNFLVDWLLLLGVNRLSGFPPALGRTAAAAAVGGGYAGICLVPGFRFLGNLLWRGISLGLISLTAFGMDRTAARRGALFVMLSMALGGLALSADSRAVHELLFCAGVLTLLCCTGFRQGMLRQRLEVVRLTFRGKTQSIHALVDTGNTLTDPLSGEPVLVVDRQIAREFFGLNPDCLADPSACIRAYPELGLRLIPCTTVGGQGGLLTALRCDEVRIGKGKGSTLVALAPVSFGGEYHGLTGGY